MTPSQSAYYKDLGEKLKRARDAVHLTQARAAEAIGLNRTSITNIEKGRQPVQVHLLAEFANLYQTDIENLIVESAPAVKEEATKSILDELPPSKRKWAERILATINHRED
jgi:transcriptional regulator with XRE-family HTH domain